MVELKTKGELDAMREAGRLVATALSAVRAQAGVGVCLRELDEVAAEVISAGGGTPAFLGYHPDWAPRPYPGVLCTSVNDAVVHAIPNDYRLREGDLLSVDCGAFVDGWCGDAAISVIAGAEDPADRALIDTTARALHAGIAAATVGAKIGDISATIGAISRAAGYGQLRHNGGHGIGRAMHEDPHVANDGRPGRGMTLRAGLAIAIEPMFNTGGSDDYRTGDDGWALLTADGTRAAHVEHTIAITEDGPWILTIP